jgi:hypothetical protein
MVYVLGLDLVRENDRFFGLDHRVGHLVSLTAPGKS